MDKKTMLRVFGEAFLRSMVVLMAIVIVCFATFFIIKVNTDKKELAAKETEMASTEYTDDELHAMLEEENANDTEATTTEETTTEEMTTEEATTEVQQIPSTDKNIIVLNSTSVTGLASAWMNKIQNAGFSKVAIGNYNLGVESQTKIYVPQEGMGEDLLTYFNGATIVVGSLESANYTIKSGGSIGEMEIFIVIGSDNTTVQ